MTDDSDRSGLKQTIIGFEALLESIVERMDGDTVLPSFAPSDEQIDRAIVDDASTPQYIVDFWQRRHIITLDSIFHLLSASKPSLDVPRFYTLLARLWPTQKYTSLPSSSLFNYNVMTLACRVNSPALIECVFVPNFWLYGIYELLVTKCNSQEPLAGLRALITCMRNVQYEYIVDYNDFIRYLLSSKNIDVMVEIGATMRIETKSNKTHLYFTRDDMNIGSQFNIMKKSYFLHNLIVNGQDEVFGKIMHHPQCYFTCAFEWKTDVLECNNIDSVIRSAIHYVHTCFEYSTSEDDTRTVITTARKWKHDDLRDFVILYGKYHDEAAHVSTCELILTLLHESVRMQSCTRKDIVSLCVSSNVVIVPFTRDEALLGHVVSLRAFRLFIDIVENTRDTAETQWALVNETMNQCEWNIFNATFGCPFVVSTTPFIFSLVSQTMPSNTEQLLDYWTRYASWSMLAKLCIERLQWPVPNARALLHNISRPETGELTELLINRL